MRLISKLCILCLSVLGVFGIVFASYDNQYEIQPLSLISRLSTSDGYTQWFSIDGEELCNSLNPLDVLNRNNQIENFKLRGANVVYLENTSIESCFNNFEAISVKLQEYHFQLAVPLITNPNLILNSLKNLDIKSIRDNFSKYASVANWVNYITIDNIADRLTFFERRILILELRNIFTKPFLGFTFTREIVNNINSAPQRENYTPGDDEGDFAIFEDEKDAPQFKRTIVIIKKPKFKQLIGSFDGHFISP